MSFSYFWLTAVTIRFNQHYIPQEWTRELYTVVDMQQRMYSHYPFPRVTRDETRPDSVGLS